MSRFASSYTPSSTSLDTIALHGDHGRRSGEPLVGSLVQSTTFLQTEVGSSVPHAYSRASNPTVSELESLLGVLENAPPAVTFGTGLGAETALFLTLLKAGDHVVIGDAIYGGTIRICRNILSNFGITSTFVDSTRVASVAAAITPRTKLVFIETPANPTLVLTDIAAISRVTRAAGIPLAVDNTFLTPVIQRPLDLGADICVYSTTKNIEGHSSALGGAITSRDEAFLEKLRFIRKSTGGIQSPLNAWLTTRGIKTLPLRIREHSRSALTIARWLDQHPAIERVNYPGLDSFPQAALAKAQHGEFHGGVISFELRSGTPVALRFLKAVRLCALVEHIGSVETLVTHSATMTHGDVPPDVRRAAGISDGLVRLSVGLENPADIIADLDQAFYAASDSALTSAAAGGVL